MEFRRKKNLQRVLSICRFLLGIALLVGLLLWDNNAQRLWRLVRTVRLEIVIVLFLVGFTLNWISCLKWRLFLKERRFNVSLFRLLSLYFIGKFFSNFIPSMIGGDLTRTYLLGRQINSHSQSFASVFLERFTGLIALIVLAVFFFVINTKMLKEPTIGLAIVCIASGSFLSIGLLFNRRLVEWCMAKFSSVFFLKVIFQKISVLQNDILYFKGKYRLLMKAMAYSFIFHFMTSVNVYLCCLAINFDPSFLDIAVITPVILLLNTLPLSPNNIGWWEWTFTILLAEAGAGPTEGLAVGLMLRAISLLFSLTGGALFLFGKAGKRTKERDFEEQETLAGLPSSRLDY